MKPVILYCAIGIVGWLAVQVNPWLTIIAIIPIMGWFITSDGGGTK